VHDNEVHPHYDDYRFTSPNQNDSINRLPHFNTDADNTNDSFSVSRISGTKQQKYTSKSSYPVHFNTGRRSLSGSREVLFSMNFYRRRDADTFFVNDNTAKISNSRIRKCSTTKTRTKSMRSTSSQPIRQNIPLILSLIFLTDFLCIIFQANSTQSQYGHKNNTMRNTLPLMKF